MAIIPDRNVDAAEKARSACPMPPCWIGFGLLSPPDCRLTPACFIALLGGFLLTVLAVLVAVVAAILHGVRVSQQSQSRNQRIVCCSPFPYSSCRSWTVHPEPHEDHDTQRHQLICRCWHPGHTQLAVPATAQIRGRVVEGNPDSCGASKPGFENRLSASDVAW